MPTQRRNIDARWAIALSLALIAWLSASPAWTAPAAPPALALDGPASAPASATTIDVAVRVSDAANLAAFEADLRYDPALVTVAGITAGGFLGDASAGCEPEAARCEATLGPLPQGAAVTAIGAYAFGTGSAAGGSGTLATVHLVPTGATGTLTLTLSNALAAGDGAQPITPTVQSAVIRLVAGGEVYLPLVLRQSSP